MRHDKAELEVNSWRTSQGKLGDRKSVMYVVFIVAATCFSQFLATLLS